LRVADMAIVCGRYCYGRYGHGRYGLPPFFTFEKAICSLIIS